MESMQPVTIPFFYNAWYFLNIINLQIGNIPNTLIKNPERFQNFFEKIEKVKKKTTKMNSVCKK